MDLYENERAFWDECVLRFVIKNAPYTKDEHFFKNAAAFADQMILVRRERDIIKD